MPAPIPLLRLLSADHFISGALIAEQLGISRASVSNALADAEQYGIALERRHGLGYRLASPIEWLDAASIRAGLPADSALQVEIVDRIESTNRALLADPRHGRVLTAEWQEGGRGRLGRKWLGALGGSLLFSVAWSFPGGLAQLAGLPLAVGASLAETLAARGVNHIGLKWPNDLLLPEGKVGGILIEMQGDALGPAQVVIGIGINLSLPSHWQAQLNQPAATLCGAGLAASRNALFAQLLADLESALRRFADEGFSSFRSAWEARHAWRGAEVEARAPDGRVMVGVARGVADDGSLRLDSLDGEILIHTGDISLRKRDESAA